MEASSLLEIGVSITIIIGAAWGLLRFLISNEVRPRAEAEKRLADMLNRLEKSIDKLSVIVDKVGDRQQETERRLAVAEQSLKRAHKRIDEMREDISKFAHFCLKTHEKDGLDITPVEDVIRMHQVRRKERGQKE